MKILLIGALNSNHTKRWANAMAARGHTVMVAHRPDQTDDMGDLHPSVKTAALKFGGTNYSYYLNVPSLRKIYKKFRPDVVNAHYATGYTTLARLAGARPLISSCWGSDVYDFPLKSKLNRRMLCKNLNQADAVASTSYAMADQARKMIGDPDRAITVTPFGVDTDLFSPAEQKVENQRPVIGIVKYLEPIYDIPLLIRAFALTYHSSGEVKPILSITGSGRLKEELVALADSLGVGDSVFFHDTIKNTEVPNTVRGFDIFVNCSLRESFGVAVVEAMACQIPVVVTNAPGYREVVVDGETGIILPDRDPETMAAAFRKLLGDPALRERYGKAGRKRVLENYVWKNNITTMENLYISVAEKHRKRRGCV